ncbi:MAG: hypothetical protein ACTS6H_01670 [Candidatus Hodgkinia cicadicola]
MFTTKNVPPNIISKFINFVQCAAINLINWIESSVRFVWVLWISFNLRN